MNSNCKAVSGVFGQKRELAERVNSLFLTRCGLCVLLLLGFWLAGISSAWAAIICHRTVTADVVAIDQPLMFNRLGAQNINGMVFALKRDVVDDSVPPKPLTQGGSAKPGHVFLRPDKRPRPLVLRVAAGDCLDVTLTNLLTPLANQRSVPPGLTPPNGQNPLPTTVGGSPVTTYQNLVVDDQVADRMVSFHVQGMQLATGISDDASMVGQNPSSLVPQAAPGNSKTYHLYAEKEGTFLATSHGATFGSDGAAGNNTNGLFGAVNVEPVGAKMYRSQVTDEEMRLATTGTTTTGQPIINYEAKYPNGQPWLAEGKAGLPILNLLTAANEIVHSDINAVIAGSNADGMFPPSTYPLESIGKNNPSLPDRLQPFREFTVIFHDEMAKTNAFEHFYDRSPAAHNPLGHTLQAVGDVFMINYGSAGIGSEIIANRLGVGPMHDCLGCNAEEFFLTSHVVGDPAMVVDIPANFGLENCKPIAAPQDGNPTTFENCAATGPKATRAYYPDDPSNVHHSYISDHVKFRNVHTGKEHHIFHLHNHQWLYNPNDDNSNYLDAQAVGPGSGYTYEINFGGSGNRNKSAGDAIFHCHLYPHFAQGMWELWRNHDVFESGTPLQVSGSSSGFHTTPFALQDGMPLLDPADSTRHLRALPDGEIRAGTPIPGLVPLPSIAMAPMPGKVYVVENTNRMVPLIEPTTGAPILDKKGNPKKVAGASLAKVDRTDKDAALINHTMTPLNNEINPTGLKNPGYPFWIAGVEQSVGQRPPNPPLDMMPAHMDPLKKDFQNGGWDGGLPRHTLDGISVAAAVADPVNHDPATVLISNVTRFDLSKRSKVAKPIWFPEDGTDLEKAAMAFHSVRTHASTAVSLNGAKTPALFITNGSGRPVAGAPFHEPCIDDTGKVMGDDKLNPEKSVVGQFFDGKGEKRTTTTTTGSSPFNADHPRVYKGADIQFDAVFNKAGWHYPQERIIALWEDAVPIINKGKAPEPLVMRDNTFDCTMYLHTNLVPDIYEMDDFEVRTSTDIIGQHIHLPKWDLTTTDGSGNGWNYEDGTLAPGAVVERIKSINEFNQLQIAAGQTAETKDVEGNPVYTSGNLVGRTTPIGPTLVATSHPYFGSHTVPQQDWIGARTTLQRWFFDPVVNAEGIHRGLGIIFTHDHFGPSTHQQVGLYATVLVEPAGSTWVHNETGDKMYTRPDGGPTSWQAVIKTGTDKEYVVDGVPAQADLDRDNEDDSYREFYLEYSDFQHAYLPGKYVGANQFGPKPEPKEAPGAKGTLSPPDRDKDSFKFAINPPVKKDASQIRPLDLVEYDSVCPDGSPRPCPEAITADDPGTMVVNYRNEPIGLRILDTETGEQATGPAGDLAYALQTFNKHRHNGAKRVYRVANASFGTKVKNPADLLHPLRGVLNKQPKEGDFIGGSINGTKFPAVLQSKNKKKAGPAKSLAKPGDPFTPILRAYYGDRIRLKVQAGGDEETHNATVHGLKWLQGGSGFGFDPNSGWRNSQQGGISEQFTFAAPILPLFNVRDKQTSEDVNLLTLLKDDLLEDLKKGVITPEDMNLLNSLRNDLLKNFKLDVLKDLKNEVLKNEVLKLKNLKNDFLKDSDEDDDGYKDNLKQAVEVAYHQNTDHLYAVDASTEGYWNGAWGILRTYGKELRNDLQMLPNNPMEKGQHLMFDPKKVKDVCPTDARNNPIISRSFDISAVLANDVLENNVSAVIPSIPFVQPADGAGLPLSTNNLLSKKDSLNPAGGTLVYNPRDTNIPDVTIPADPATGEQERTIPGHEKGVLHDPTAIMYVMTADLQAKSAVTSANAPDCFKTKSASDPTLVFDPTLMNCPAKMMTLKPTAPVEPLVLRAKAGECVTVRLRNRLGAKGAPDVLTYRQLSPVIPMNPNGKVFNANRIRTSSVVGLHPALVAYDVTTNDGTAVGLNDDKKTLAVPEDDLETVLDDRIKDYRWYAGDISVTPDKPLVPGKWRTYNVVRTPIEFGGSNLMPADKIKQGQKGLVGALVIEPERSTWAGDLCDKDPAARCVLDQVDDHQGTNGTKRDTRLSTTVTVDGGMSHFRDLVTVIQKGLTHLYGDGKPVEGIAAEQVLSEDAEDGGALAINYGSEPLWFRFGLPANMPFTPLNGSASLRDIPNAHEAYSNNLAGVGGDPAVPVLTAVAGEEFRMHVLEPAGTSRGSVFNLHGHVWQRAPYVCLGSSYLGLTLTSVCPNTGFFPTLPRAKLPKFEVGSRAIGINSLSMYLGGQDSILPAAHFDIVLPKAGGENAIPGDYLYKDQAGFGNLGGLWGIVRVCPKGKGHEPSDGHCT